VHVHEETPQAPPMSELFQQDGLEAADNAARPGALLTARLQLLEVDLVAGDETPQVPTVLSAALQVRR
jgi:hypothetical protein